METMMTTLALDTTKFADNFKIKKIVDCAIKNAQCRKMSDYVAYIDHSDYCIGFDDNG